MGTPTVWHTAYLLLFHELGTFITFDQGSRAEHQHRPTESSVTPSMLLQLLVPGTLHTATSAPCGTKGIYTLGVPKSLST